MNDLRCISEGSQPAGGTHCLSPFMGKTFGTTDRPTVARAGLGGGVFVCRGGTGNSQSDARDLCVPAVMAAP